MNATFTDPNDSSAWFYQRWLLDRCMTTCRLWRACINKDTAIIVIDNNILIEPVSLSLYVNSEAVDVQWQLYPDEKFAKLQIARFVNPLENLDHAKEVFIKLQETTYELSYSKLESAWIYKDNSSLHKQNSNDEQLNEQLKSYNQLSKMEPNNKWALLTGILLMKKIDFKQFYTDILNNLVALSKVDSLRKNYYKDLRKYNIFIFIHNIKISIDFSKSINSTYLSFTFYIHASIVILGSKLLVEYKLLEIWKGENDLEIQSRIDLSGLDLTKLHNNHYFSLFEEVNLGANQLENSLRQFSTLQRCIKLSLSSNSLTSLKHLPTLHNLEVFSLRNNKLASTEEILNLIKRHKNLKRLDLRDNPVCEKINIVQIQDMNCNLEICLK